MADIHERSRWVANGELQLRVADHGAGDECVMLLHGWPDTASLWRHQVPALVEAGYRAIAPDMRGRGQSDRPEDVGDYRVSVNVGDMLAVMDDAGVERAHVVAHDWGASVGWALALRHPGRVASLTALSVGHPNSFSRAGLRQLQMSWYMLLFQFEDVAETFLSANDWAMFRRFVGEHSETERWIECLSEPGALTASLNWYRANAHPRRLVSPSPPAPSCAVPTLGVWSDGDMALTERQMTGSEEHVAGEWEYRRIEGASHWIPLDVPDELNEILLDWLNRHPAHR